MRCRSASRPPRPFGLDPAAHEYAHKFHAVFWKYDWGAVVGNDCSINAYSLTQQSHKSIIELYIMTTPLGEESSITSLIRVLEKFRSRALHKEVCIVLGKIVVKLDNGILRHKKHLMVLYGNTDLAVLVGDLQVPVSKFMEFGQSCCLIARDKKSLTEEELDSVKSHADSVKLAMVQRNEAKESYCRYREYLGLKPREA